MYYVLIDTSVTALVLKKAPMREIQLHARLVAFQKPGIRLIAPPVEGRSLSKLSDNQLVHLIWGFNVAPADDYSQRIQQALQLIEAMEPDTTPLASLEREVAKCGAPEPNLNHPTATPAAAAPKPPKAPKAPREPSSRPAAGTSTGKVWDLADRLRAELGRLPTGKEVVAAGEAEGLKAGTISVQFGKWKSSIN